MASLLKLTDIGKLGVNVDADPISLDDQELRSAQNAIRDPLGADSGLRKRPGLLAYNGSLTAGEVLGGICVPLKNLSSGGVVTIYIGRGPI
jgi:hypothetical protein